MFAEVWKGLLGSAGASRGLLLCARLCRGVLASAGVSTGLQRFAEVCRGVLRSLLSVSLVLWCLLP